jgi:hypothetical protein
MGDELDVASTTTPLSWRGRYAHWYTETGDTEQVYTLP